MAPRGPLPTGTAQRRNAPTIPTTSLPVSGRKTPTPKPPLAYSFGPAAADWWAWAWHTPQACAWDDGQLFVVARRAQLEDDLKALADVDVNVAELLGFDEVEASRQLDQLIGRLKALAGGRLQVAREIRELDDRLGLTAKGLAALRWKIVADDEASPSKPGPSKTAKKTTGRRLKAVG